MHTMAIKNFNLSFRITVTILKWVLLTENEISNHVTDIH